MNIKVKAAGIVAGMLGIGMTATIAIKLAFTYIPIEILSKISMVVIMGGLLSLTYTMVLEQLKSSEKYKNKLKDMVDQK